MASCSKEEDVQTNTDSQFSATLKSTSPLEVYYNDMLSSSSYTRYKVSENAFLSGMPNAVDLSTVNDERSFKIWLSRNIAQTSFADYNDAIQKLDTMKSDYSIVATENSQFFLELERNPEAPGQFAELINTNQYETVLYNDCFNGCVNDAVACDKASRENDAAGIGASGVGSFFNPVLAVATAIYATIVYNNAQEACARTFNGCAHACGY